MQIGRVYLNPQELSGITKEEFFALVAGNIDTDRSEEWELFSKEAEKQSPKKGLKNKDVEAS